MSKSDSLSVKQKKFVASLMACRTVKDAAREAGVSEKTAYRYLSDERVKRALSVALDDALSEVTRRVVSAMTNALDVLLAVAQDRTAPASSRVAAARSILGFALQMREATDLAERLSVLEAKQKGG